MDYNRRRQWAQIALEIRRADSRYWLEMAFYGAGIVLASYLLTVILIARYA